MQSKAFLFRSDYSTYIFENWKNKKKAKYFVQNLLPTLFSGTVKTKENSENAALLSISLSVPPSILFNIMLFLSCLQP